MSWFNNVLGGVERPAFYTIAGTNLCTNPLFDDGTTGWVGEDSDIILERRNEEDAYKEYMLRIRYESESLFKYVKYDFDRSYLLSGRYFIYSFRIKNHNSNSHEVLIKINGGNGYLTNFYSKLFTVEKGIKKISIVIKVPSDDSETTGLRFILYPNKDSSVTNFNGVYIDNVQIYESTERMLFPEPNRDNMEFEKYVQGQNQPVFSYLREFNKKYIPIYNCEYDYISREYQILRETLAHRGNLYCFPHSDYNWGFLGKFDGGYDRNYFMNKYLGHSGAIVIRGNEFVIESPFITEISAGGGSADIDYGGDYGESYGDTL